jgi:hypothetical protein
MRPGARRSWPRPVGLTPQRARRGCSPPGQVLTRPIPEGWLSIQHVVLRFHPEEPEPLRALNAAHAGSERAWLQVVVPARAEDGAKPLSQRTATYFQADLAGQGLGKGGHGRLS